MQRLEEAAWDGWASQLLGSATTAVLGALTVVLGVWLASRLENKRRAREAQAAMASELIRQVSDLLDVTTRSRTADEGKWHLWPMRQSLQVAGAAMGDAPTALDRCWDFYLQARRLREWLRSNPSISAQAKRDALRAYQSALDSSGEEALAELRKVASDKHTYAPSPTQMPTLPWRAPEV